MGWPLVRTTNLERGHVLIATADPTRPTSGFVLLVGIGRRRGVPHESPDFERGYYLDKQDGRERWLDAATGRLLAYSPGNARRIHEHDEQPLLDEVLAARQKSNHAWGPAVDLLGGR